MERYASAVVVCFLFCISLSSVIMNSRIDFGHWELSNVIDKAEGQGEFLLVLSERLTQDKIIGHVISKAAQATIDSVRKPLTEFQNCEKIW